MLRVVADDQARRDGDHLQGLQPSQRCNARERHWGGSNWRAPKSPKNQLPGRVLVAESRGSKHARPLAPVLCFSRPRAPTQHQFSNKATPTFCHRGELGHHCWTSAFCVPTSSRLPRRSRLRGRLHYHDTISIHGAPRDTNPTCITRGR